METLYSVVLSAREYDVFLKFTTKALMEAANDPVVLQVKKILDRAVGVSEEEKGMER